MSRKLGNVFIVCVVTLGGLTVGNAIGGLLVGLVLMPLAGVLGYKYCMEPAE